MKKEKELKYYHTVSLKKSGLPIGLAFAVVFLSKLAAKNGIVIDEALWSGAAVFQRVSGGLRAGQRGHTGNSDLCH